MGHHDVSLACTVWVGLENTVQLYLKVNKSSLHPLLLRVLCLSEPNGR